MVLRPASFGLGAAPSKLSDARLSIPSLPPFTPQEAALRLRLSVPDHLPTSGGTKGDFEHVLQLRTVEDGYNSGR